MRKFFSFVAAALIASAFAGKASAEPLFNLTVLGSSTGAAGSFTSDLEVAGGQTYFYQVLVSPAAIGTSNTQGAITRTINSLTAADGANSLSFNLVDTANDAIPVDFALPTLAAAWTAGTGASAGTLAPGDSGVNGIRPIRTPGQFSGPEAVLVLSGTFTTPGSLADGLVSAIALSWGTTNAGLRINGGTTTFFANPTTENGADPIFGLNALTVRTQAVPEPSSLALTGLGVAGCVVLAIRRRRQAC